MGQDPSTLTQLIQSIRPGDDEEGHLTVQELLNRLGPHSFAPAILVPALILVSPLSAIPGSPTVGMLIIVTLVVQALVGRGSIWLPGFLMNRRLPVPGLRKAMDRLKPSMGWIDRHSRNRFRLLTVAPLNRIAMLAILATVLPWPLMEALPLVTSIGAFAVSLLAVGLVLRDGLWVIAGFAFQGLLVTLMVSIWRGWLF